MDKEYQILYTESAIQDMEEKADHIAFNLHAPDLAERWYLRLKAGIRENQASFPYR